MRRSRFLPFALLLLVLVSLPVAARTSPLSSASEDVTGTSDVGSAAEEQAEPTNKATVAKRSTVPATAKTHPAVRGNDPAPTRAQRWHRFLPGMYR